ncbi:MAG: ATP-binding protein, partial [Cyanobacteriota bacterium]|nr:ATP-binding protein [Cyanobacteriota bacterium]
GTGIAPEIQDKLFDPFFTTKPVGKGTGLGLSICYQIIEKHRGTIEVISEPGWGTEFTIYLPVWQDLNQREPCEERARVRTPYVLNSVGSSDQ